MPKLILNMEVNDWQTFKKIYVEKDNPNREKVGIKKIFIGKEENRPNKVHAIFDIPHSNSMREYVESPEVKKVVLDSGIKLETLGGVVCED